MQVFMSFNWLAIKMNQQGENTKMMELVERALKALESIAQSLEIMTNRQDMIVDDVSDELDNTPAATAEPATKTTPAEPAPEPESTTPSGTQDLDAEGLPWDARIHGSGQTFLSDRDPKRPGCWKYIKGLQTKNPDLIAQVEAELREKYGASSEPAVEQPSTPEQPTTPDTSAVNTINAPGGMFDPSANAPAQPQTSQVSQPVAVQQPVQQPVTQEISKEELEAACSNPVSDPKLAHINYLATKIIQRDGVAKVNEILPMYTGGVTELTKVPDNLFPNVYAVFYNQWNFHNPQGTQG